MPNVLILGGRAPVALDHARRFARQGWKAFIADSVPCRISGWSRTVTGTVRLRSPRFEPTGFTADLRRAVERHRIDLVIPTCEEVFYLSRYRNALPSSVLVAADDFDKLRMLHSKWRFQELARECGIGAPETSPVRSLAEAREWSKGESAVLKPEFSRFGVHARIYPRGIPNDAPAFQIPGTWAAQRFCAGREVCSYGIAWQGRLLAHCAYLPKYRLGQSSSYFFQGVDAPDIRARVETLVSRIGFTGQISFDWILTENHGPMVLECNPRAISGLHLFSPGDSLPEAFMGKAIRCVEPSDTRPKMIASIMLSAGFAWALRNRALAAWSRDFRTARDVLADGMDVLPSLGGLADIGSFARIAARRGCSLREAATRDIEWDGEDLP